MESHEGFVEVPRTPEPECRMKARRRERSGATPPAEISEPSEGGDMVLVALDAALGSLRHREFLTRDEAIQMLLDVRASAHNDMGAPRVASLVNDALLDSFDGQIIDKQRVADVLLDLRLALTQSSWRDDAAELEAAYAAGW